MIFRVKMQDPNGWFSIRNWLEANASDDEYQIIAESGHMYLKFVDEGVATMCKIMWPDLLINLDSYITTKVS